MDDDDIIEQDGFSFCVNKQLMIETGGVVVDVSYMGFVIEPKNPLSSPASNCGSSCGSSCGQA